LVNKLERESSHVSNPSGSLSAQEMAHRPPAV
jgi:hypothetical protein